MPRSLMHQEIDSVPELVRVMLPRLTDAISQIITPTLSRQIRRVYVTGCGDSYYAGLTSKLTFEQLAGLPCEPMPAMQFGRYATPFLPAPRAELLTLAVSVSGKVSRTVEALRLAQHEGVTAVAITGNPHSPLAQVAKLVLQTTLPPFPQKPSDQVVPGMRSYVASQLALFLTAIHLGEQRGHLTGAQADGYRHDLAHTANLMAETIELCDPIARETAVSWTDADRFVWCGTGPNYGTAHFCAAKIIEASGDTAVAQDTEEWAHIQYFEKQPHTPTFLISAGHRDQSRTVEIATAATHIGRRVGIIAPATSLIARTAHKAAYLPVALPLHECFSPLLTCLPGALFAAWRAETIGEPYFRAFGGGRSSTGGGGISRIQTSDQIDIPDRNS